MKLTIGGKLINWVWNYTIGFNH